MGEWYWIGVCTGVGAGVGAAVAGIAGSQRKLLLVALIVGAAAGAAIGFGIDDWDEALGGGLGGVAGAVGAGELVPGTLRRGGTRAGTAALFVLGGLGVAALGFAPGVGYAEAVLLPALAVRLRRRSAGRYAGLRTLARD